ncbi:MAG: hypothetical protein LIP16_03720 [Clostridium sp.]|nr:hypothetical protein [Clostridium sp.]
MDKSKWFESYCDMSEDEKWVYREFEMEEDCKIQLNIYKRMYDAVSLMALDYEKQIDALPKGINIADEIALVFDDEVIAVMDALYKSGMLSLDACALINNIGNKLSEMGIKHDANLWTLEALKQSNLWEQCREKAKQLLSILCKLE